MGPRRRQSGCREHDLGESLGEHRSSDRQENTDKMVVEIPVLVNSSAVEINDELTVYRAPAVGKTKRGASTHLGATVKTPKVA